MNDFKPMLADTVENIETLNYPVYASPKLDGIRAVIIRGVLMSRNLKPIPNAHVQGMFGKGQYNGLDGELIMGNPCSPTCFRDTSSAVMSKEGKPDVRFYVFDKFEVGVENSPFSIRQALVKGLTLHKNMVRWLSVKVSSPQGLTHLEEVSLEAGYEGVMIRSTNGPYKFGRSTLKEGYLLKLKRFMDGEAEIIGVEEQMHNGNEATKDALGRTKRSTHKAGKSGTGKLGALLVRDIKTGVEFSVGSGFSDEERDRIWSLSASCWIGSIVKYRYFPTGSKEKPRFPTYCGFRDKIDF